MDKLTLNNKIALWKAIPLQRKGEVDEFIQALIDRVEDLEHEAEELAWRVIEVKNRG